MTDLRPLLPLTEIDVDPTPSDKEWASFQSRVSDFNTRFLADFNDPTVDTGAMDYAAAAESTWFGYVRELRHSMPADVPRAKISWAQFRYNWCVLVPPKLSRSTLTPPIGSAFSCISHSSTTHHTSRWPLA